MYAYEKYFNRLPRPLVRFLRNVYLSWLDLKDRLTGKSKDLIPPRSLHFIGGGDFEQIGTSFVTHFANIGKLQRHETVLDIGCGTGRMAGPLMQYLDASGHYMGFDISEKAIAWCQKNITKRNPNFTFYYADISNTEYNPNGEIPASEYRFPCEDNSVDFAFATSVFTHMRKAEVTNYLAELYRSLKPSGRAMLSFFVLDQKNRDLMNSGHAVLNFTHDMGESYTIDAKTPERAIAYSEEDIHTMVEAAGLQFSQPILFGSWSGRASMLSVQDFLMVTKKASA